MEIVPQQTGRAAILSLPSYTLEPFPDILLPQTAVETGLEAKRKSRRVLATRLRSEKAFNCQNFPGTVFGVPRRVIVTGETPTGRLRQQMEAYQEVPLSIENKGIENLSKEVEHTKLTSILIGCFTTSMPPNPATLAGPQHLERLGVSIERFRIRVNCTLSHIIEHFPKVTIGTYFPQSGQLATRCEYARILGGSA